MMIIPLPTLLLDILITANISIAVVLLLVSIYVANALRIASLPSILLITTLFRLGLNVSSTRLILLQADAGTVIESFGNFVVAGNLVVGGVVFLILTVIQFIVIAKGSERVAEVAARFTLDAMPGKQMAIDADVRAGNIDTDRARALRSTLQRESQLYGSMDGAMKFVKGDAIAGIIITVVNIVGGLLIGVFQQQMEAAEAIRLYSVLTIGDGLVSQIPALLISTAAGIVVTRVASEDEGAHLGREIGEQILAQPRAIGIGAVLLLALALVPGLPTLPFMIMAAIFAVVAYGLHAAKSKRVDRDGGEVPLVQPDATDFVPAAGAALELGVGLAQLVDGEGEGRRRLRELIPGLRELIYQDLGVVLPGVHLRSRIELLSSDEYQILIGEVPLVRGRIPAGTTAVVAAADDLQRVGVASHGAVNFLGLSPAVTRIAREDEANVAAAGYQLVDSATEIVLHLGQVLRGAAAEFVGIEETQRLLDTLATSHPTLVHEVVPRIVSLQTLADVLRRLVAEGIPIRNLRAILESIAEWGQVDKDALQLAEHARVALRRFISHRFGGTEGRVLAYLLDPSLEEAVRDSIQQTPQGGYLALEPALSREIMEAVRRVYAGRDPDSAAPVILTGMDLRRYVRRLIEAELPQLHVLSYSELLPEVRIDPLARIEVGRVA
jgi:type III secretion protein V